MPLTTPETCPGRSYLAAYLRSERAFGRCPARGTVDESEWIERLKSRWLAWIAAHCSLADVVWKHGEVVTKTHFAKINLDGELRVIRYRRVYRFTGREITRAA